MNDAAQLRAQRRRTNRARRFPANTCPASRHVHMIADALASGHRYAEIDEDPKHCGASMLSVLESLWKARTQIARLEAQRERAR
jgi:hypothetical protein